MSGGTSYEWMVPEIVASSVWLRVSLYDEVGLIGHDSSDGPFAIVPRTTSRESDRVPGSVALLQNVPNPFNPTTRITFELPVASVVHPEVFDSRGQLVRNLLRSESPAGRHEVTWEGRDGAVRQLASGAYFLRMRAGDRTATCRMVLMK